MSDETRQASPGRARRRDQPCHRRGAADFKQCPLLYRFRAIDRLPEPPSTAQVRGSVVHAALEQLYGLPAAQAAGPADRPTRLVGSGRGEQVIAAEPELVDQLGCEQQTHLLDEGPQAAVRLLQALGRPDPVRPAELRAAHRGRTC